MVSIFMALSHEFDQIVRVSVNAFSTDGIILRSWSMVKLAMLVAFAVAPRWENLLFLCRTVEFRHESFERIVVCALVHWEIALFYIWVTPDCLMSIGAFGQGGKLQFALVALKDHLEENVIVMRAGFVVRNQPMFGRQIEILIEQFPSVLTTRELKIDLVIKKNKRLPSK